MVDILLLSFSSRLFSSTSLELAGQHVNLMMHPNAEVGFIRLRQESTGEWRVEPDYVYNITSDLNLVGTKMVSPIEIAGRLQIRPNPVREMAEIEFGVEETGSVRLSVFDSQGRAAAVLIDSTFGPGLHRTSWSSSNLASGVYFLRLTKGGRHESKSFVISR